MAKRQSKSQSKKRAKAKAADDAIELLTADHRRVKELFEKFESESSEDEKQAVARQICEELVMHAVLEEEIFYAACREQGVEEDPLNEAQIEHDTAKVLIANVQMAENDYFDAEVKVLKEYVLHHLAEEEQPRNGIFARARAGGLDLAALGAQIKERKQELVELQAGNRLPRPALKALQLPRLTNAMRMSGDNDMARQDEQYRNERDRYDEDDRYSRGGSSSRSRYDRDDDRSSSRGNDRPRDDQGRFMSDDDRGGSSRSSGRDDYRSSSRGEGRGQGGWFGDPEGHSEASRRGWDDRGSSRSESRSSRSRDEDDDRGRSRSSRDDDRGQGGWFGDPEGHSEASRRGWEERSSSSRSGNGSRGRSMSMRDDDDDRGRSRSSRDDDRSQGGWFGDPRGHSEAARRGWEERGGSRMRGRDDDDDRGRSRGGRDDERGQGGWFGDPEGHSEASRRGWAQRR